MFPYELPLGVPANIVEIARYWGDFRPNDGNLSEQHPTPLVVPYEAAACRLMDELRKLARHERRHTPEPYATLWTRTLEKARKLALIWACSANPTAPIVTREAAAWAVQGSEYLTRRMIYLASCWVSENPHEGNLKRLLRTIEAAGPNKLDKSELSRATQWINRRERDDLIATLIESGSIVAEQVPTKTKTRTLYCASRFVTPFLQSFNGSSYALAA